MLTGTHTSRPQTRWRGPAPHPTEDSMASKPVSSELVSSLLPPAMLQQDEIVLLLVKPSLWFIFLTSLRFMLVVTFLCVLIIRGFALNAASYLTPQTLATTAALVSLGRLIWALLVWTSHIYLLTNQRLVTIKGVLNVSIYQANLRKIQRTILYRPLMERLLGLGTIGFATAATNTFDSSWVMIPHSLQTHESIVAAINKVQ